MIKGMIGFMKGILGLPLWVQLWMGLIMVVNIGVSWFFLEELAAQLVLVSMVGVTFISSMMVATTGFNKYLGIMHGPWVVVVYFHIYTLATRPDLDPNFRIWLIASLTTMGLSLVLDVFDVFKYQRQQK